MLERVKPERDHNNRTGRREKWWLFGETNPKLRKQLSGLPRYIAAVETAKHRTFQFLDASILPDNMLIAIALDDGYTLGVLSSRVHAVWALAAGGTLEDRPRYNKSRCFEPFPFAVATVAQRQTITRLAEQIDAHRKRQQTAHIGLTLTGMYNVLEKLRLGTPLTAREKTIHEQGLVAVLNELHNELDTAVLAAYGWDNLTPKLINQPGGLTPLVDKPAALAAAEEELLTKLAALNAARAIEEAQGTVRWQRPDFQNPAVAQQSGIDMAEQDEVPDTIAVDAKENNRAVKLNKQPWPAQLPAQIAAVAAVLAASNVALTDADIAAHFSGRGAWKKRLPQLLETLVALARAHFDGARYRAR